MTNRILLFIALLSSLLIRAQLADDMEAYTEGSKIFQGHWTDWNGSGTHALYASSTHANSGILSGYIPPDGTTDAILDLGNKVGGQWGVKFMMYVPSNKEAQMYIQGEIPVNSGIWTVGNIFFNKDNNSPGTGYVNYQSSSSSYWSFFNFPHDQWFEVIFNIHLNNNWQLLINGNVEIDWTEYGRWVEAGQFEYSNLLGGINFFSSSSNCEYWIDDIDFISGFQTSSASVSDMGSNRLEIFPNPTSGLINIKYNSTLKTTIEIYSILGNLVLRKKLHNHSIDLSELKKGA